MTHILPGKVDCIQFTNTRYLFQIISNNSQYMLLKVT